MRQFAIASAHSWMFWRIQAYQMFISRNSASQTDLQCWPCLNMSLTTRATFVHGMAALSSNFKVESIDTLTRTSDVICTLVSMTKLCWINVCSPVWTIKLCPSLQSTWYSSKSACYLQVKWAGKNVNRSSMRLGHLNLWVSWSGCNSNLHSGE